MTEISKEQAKEIYEEAVRSAQEAYNKGEMTLGKYREVTKPAREAYEDALRKARERVNRK